MAYVICKAPGITMDLMVKKEYWPKLISMIERCGVTYDREVKRLLPNWHGRGDGKVEWIVIKNLHAKKNGDLGALIGLFYGMEWDSLNKEGPEEKFYILIGSEWRKNDVRKNWKKAHPGRKGGNAGKPSGDIRLGQDPGHRRDGTDPGCADPAGEERENESL